MSSAEIAHARLTPAMQLMELPSDIAQRIDEFCERARSLEDSGDLLGAIREFQSAYALIPAPQGEWEASWWLQAAIGDCQFRLTDFGAAYESFRLAMIYGEHMGNAFLRLRRGQVLYEMGNVQLGLQELAAAYMLEGRDIFQHDDPKYFRFVQENLAPPASGEW